ncbi:hypothetical protein GYMLUDRAFT_182125, partial [Collybiopsis luxurians FD-317 M1]
EMEFVWVCWLSVDPENCFGPEKARLPKIGFVDEKDKFAFGFLDPKYIIHACHLIPSFSNGCTSGLLNTVGPTVVQKEGELDDWQCFYINMRVSSIHTSLGY